MDIYDLIEALRRQWRLLAIGMALLLLAVLAGMFTFSDGSVSARFTPRSLATIQMVVVPEGVGELTDPDLTSNEYETVADVYADLLSSPRTIDQIAEATGSRINAFDVRTSNRSPIISVGVESPEADEAELAAMGAFTWLADRLELGVTVAAVTTPEVPSETIDAAVVLRVQPAFIEVDADLWFDVAMDDGSGMAMPLHAVETGAGFQTDIGAGDRITVSVGPEVGAAYDSVVMTIPDLNEEPQLGIALELLVRRGAILFDLGGEPRLNASAFGTLWENPPGPAASTGLTVMLLDEEPRAVQIGQRRGPILGAGALLAGILVLLAVSLMTDTFQQRKRLAAPRLPTIEGPRSIEAAIPLEAASTVEPADTDGDQDDESAEAESEGWNWKKAGKGDDDQAHPWSAQSS